jgi:hypothetical protein
MDAIGCTWDEASESFANARINGATEQEVAWAQAAMNARREGRSAEAMRHAQAVLKANPSAWSWWFESITKTA